jgi:urea transport system permease protein
MRAFSDRFVALVCTLGVLAVLMTGARAGPYEDGLARFTADSFDETIEGINAVATSGHALAAQVIAALQEGRLLFSGRPTSPRCASTIGCGASSKRRSAA